MLCLFYNILYNRNITIPVKTISKPFIIQHYHYDRVYRLVTFLMANAKNIIYFNRVYYRVRGEFPGGCAIRAIIFLVKHNITV